MIRVHVRRGLIGETGVESTEVPWTGGTARELAEAVRRPEWAGVPLDVAVDGALVTDDDLDRSLPDGVDVIVSPSIRGGVGEFLVFVLVSAIVSAAVSALVSLLIPTPKPPDVTQDRGDQASPTYGWDGLQTNYGQGFTVGRLYGQHALGGQVIHTNVYSTTGNPAGTAPLTETLEIILALCAGRIKDVGGITGGDLGEVDVATQASASFPSSLRVNENTLAPQSQATAATAWLRMGELGQRPIPAPFTGAATTFQVGEKLEGVSEAIYTYAGSDQIDTASIILKFPGGVYEQDPQGNIVAFKPGTTGYLGAQEPVFVQSQGNSQWKTGDVLYAVGGTIAPGQSAAWFFITTAVTIPVGPIATINVGHPGAYISPPNNPVVTDPVVAQAGGTGATLNVTWAPNPVAGVRFVLDWRYAGEVAWRSFYQAGGVLPVVYLGQSPVTGVLSTTVTAEFQQLPSSPPVYGPVEIRVRRLDPLGSPQSVSTSVWDKLIVGRATTFAYAGTALLGLQMPASEKVSGGLPRFSVDCRGTMVRVWDPILGWSAPAGGPGLAFTVEDLRPEFRFMKYSPGRNPAWIALDWILSPDGMGNALTEENVDLPAFRAWATFCDQEPGPAGSEWPEARFTFNGVIDRVRPAWEWLTAICSAGRAAPIWKGDKVSVVYQYRDAHADAGAAATGYTVPARAQSQVFCDANVADLQIDYISRGGRPSVIEYSFTNAAKQYRLDRFSVEESESYLSYLAETAPDRTRDLRRETQESFGVTRTTQLFREAVFRHRLNRLTRSIITFKTGIWALAAEPGDLIGFQHDVLRPYANQSYGLTVEVGGNSVTQVQVDRTLTPTGGTDRLVMRGPDGSPVEAEISSIVGPLVNLATAVSVNPGAPAAFGREDEILKEYVILDINLDQDGMRQIRALEYVPAVYDEPENGTGGAEDNSFAGDPGQGNDTIAEEPVDPMSIRIEPSLATHGSHVISWSKPAGRPTRRCRVYVRPTGGSTWWHLGEVRGGDSEIEYQGMSAFERWDVVVAVEDGHGTFAMPGELRPRAILTEEFPRMSPAKIRTVDLASRTEGDGVALRWEPVELADLAYYEVRSGSAPTEGGWDGATVLYRGAAPRFFWEDPPRYPGTLYLAARNRSGLYSLQTTELTPPADYLPRLRVEAAADLVETPPTLALPTELDEVDNAIVIKSGYLGGTYTTDALDLGYVAEAWWSVSAETEWHDNATVDGWLFGADSGESRWRTINARGASPARPGLAWDEDVDDWALPIDDLADRTTAGLRGQPGSHCLFRIETRFYDGSLWSSWNQHRNGFRKAQKMEARVHLFRDDLAFTARVRSFILSVAI